MKIMGFAGRVHGGEPINDIYCVLYNLYRNGDNTCHIPVPTLILIRLNKNRKIRTPPPPIEKLS